MAVLALARAERLRNERIETDEEAASKHRQNVYQNAPKTDRADGHRAVWETTYHHGVNDAHGHPADFRESKRKSKAQSGTQLGAECLELDHGSKWNECKRDNAWEQTACRGGNLRGVLVPKSH